MSERFLVYILVYISNLIQFFHHLALAVIEPVTIAWRASAVRSKPLSCKKNTMSGWSSCWAACRLRTGADVWSIAGWAYQRSAREVPVRGILSKKHRFYYKARYSCCASLVWTATRVSLFYGKSMLLMQISRLYRCNSLRIVWMLLEPDSLVTFCNKCQMKMIFSTLKALKQKEYLSMKENSSDDRKK